MPLNLTTPELDRLRKLEVEPLLRRLNGKTITKQDAFRLFEEAVREEMTQPDWNDDSPILFELPDRLMRAALENERKGVETRGRPLRK
jgi:hypothetical protein